MAELKPIPADFGCENRSSPVSRRAQMDHIHIHDQFRVLNMFLGETGTKSQQSTLLTTIGGRSLRSGTYAENSHSELLLNLVCMWCIVTNLCLWRRFSQSLSRVLVSPGQVYHCRRVCDPEKPQFVFDYTTVTFICVALYHKRLSKGFTSPCCQKCTQPTSILHPSPPFPLICVAC